MIKHYSLENVYEKIDNHIKLVQSYTEIENINFIIKACRLKPYNLFDKNNKLTVNRWWFDEFYNSFTIDNKKRVKIIYNDLRLLDKPIICTDLYYGLSLDRIIKMSYLTHFIFGKDEDLYQDCCLLTFLGIDNYLRSYLYWYGEWKTVSPLLLGMENLQLLIKNRDIKLYYKIKEKKKNCVLPCISGEAWLSSLPISNMLISKISSDVVSDVFKKE